MQRCLRTLSLPSLPLLLLLCGTARADGPVPPVESTHELYEACTSSTDALVLYCYGVIRAVAGMMTVDLARLSPKLKGVNGFDYCSADSLTVGQMTKAFKNSHDLHPEQWKMPLEIGVVLALVNTWPCNKH